MSAGHPHKAPNLLVHTNELRHLLSSDDAPQLMERWNHFDLTHDIPYTAGYNVAGTTRYADRDFVRALYDPKYAEQIIGQPIDTGLSPEQTLSCVLWHEAIEKVLLDAANPIVEYQAAHEFATAGEHEQVRKFGGMPVRYERGLERIIKFCVSKQPRHVPDDLCCAPYLDDPDANDRRILAAFRALGVTDASKLSKRSVDYGPGMGKSHCAVCAHWQNHGADELSTCAVTEGLVRTSRWCNKFEPTATTLDAVEEAARPKEKTNGQADRSRAARPAAV